MKQDLRRALGGGGAIVKTLVNSGFEGATHVANNNETNSLATERESKPSRGQDLYPRPFVGEGVRRTGEGSHSDKIAQQVRDDSACSPLR